MLEQAGLNDQEEYEISALEYARQNGIARDHFRDAMISIHNIWTLKRGEIELIDDDPSLPIFSLGSAFKVEERLQLSRDAARLISTVGRPEAIESIDALLDCRRRRKLKLELPLLKSDHALDSRNFARRDNFEIKLRDVKLPLEFVDDEKGEGLGWPASLSEVGPATLAKLKLERPQVKRDTMAFIQSASSSDWSSEDEKTLWAAGTVYKKNRTKEPITPPLLPTELPPKLYEPSSESEGYDLPILSDAPDLTQLDLDAIETRLFKQDLPTPLRESTQHIGRQDSLNTQNADVTVTMKDIYSPLASLDRDTPPPEESTRFHPEEYKVEIPLTPKLPITSPMKSVRFSDIVLQLDFDPITPSKLDGEESSYFEDALSAAHKKVTQQSEQERLVHADALSRVDVPHMDFTLPKPPWQALQEARSTRNLLPLQKDFLKAISKHVNGRPRAWIGVGTEKDLCWLPFSMHVAKAAIEDRFPGAEASWKGFVSDMKNDVIDSSALVWKPPGLMILKDEVDDEELENGKPRDDRPQDLTSLVKKRRRLIEESEGGKQDSLVSRPGEDGNSRQLPNKKPKQDSGQGDWAVDASIGNLLGGRFSARNAVDNYMEMKGTRKPELSGSSYFAGKKDELSTRALAPDPQQQIKPIALESPAVEPLTIPIPHFDIPSSPFYIVIAATMCARKDIVKTLERTLPTLNLIERDFSSHNMSAWLPRSVNRSPIASPLAAEADFIVSPSVGIIATTLQKIKQKPLPGQKTKVEIRDRVETVSLRYEKLVVLVSEDNKADTTHGLDSYDCQALTEFTTFAAGLDRRIRVQFVAGGTQTLLRWVMSVMVQNAIAEELLPEQTYWELFLRRAGMNAFAAQVILSRMKAPPGVDPLTPTKAGYFGVTGFVEMGREARIARFEEICGRRLLERVSDIIDAGWQ